jgi:hypothetical protein
MVNLVPVREQVGDRRRGWLVHDGRRDDVGHVALIGEGIDAPLDVGVESTHRCEVNVTAEDGDSEVMRGGDVLEGVDEVLALGFVGTGRPVIVEIVE